eukprot:TRINITY_DN7267_c0_g1_i1.p1 TRINITY_DN7267_c0_g1~~TRINITY_DN7267_c0_g1_i1.p1  ORF type:complete len:122 (-),score=20.54 TRINITY_DN7267_c0_g1_i1:94-438(-)
MDAHPNPDMVDQSYVCQSCGRTDTYRRPIHAMEDAQDRTLCVPCEARSAFGVQRCDHMTWREDRIVPCDAPLDENMQCLAKHAYPAVVEGLRRQGANDVVTEHVLQFAFPTLHN